MNKPKDPPPPPPIRRVSDADLSRRWEEAKAGSTDCREKCDECQAPMNTGEVLYLFEAPAAVLNARYQLCTSCAWKAFNSGNFPMATVLFIEDHHVGRRDFELPAEVREQVRMGFTQMDAIHARLDQLNAHYAHLMPKDQGVKN